MTTVVNALVVPQVFPQAFGSTQNHGDHPPELSCERSVLSIVVKLGFKPWEEVTAGAFA